MWLTVCCIISNTVGSSTQGSGLLSAQHWANPGQMGVWGETQEFPFICTLCRCCSNVATHFWGAPVKCAAETNIIFTISWCGCIDKATGWRYKPLVKVITACLTRGTPAQVQPVLYLKGLVSIHFIVTGYSLLKCPLSSRTGLPGAARLAVAMVPDHVAEMHTKYPPVKSYIPWLQASAHFAQDCWVGKTLDALSSV